MYFKKLLTVAFICTAVFAVGQAFADDADDGFDADETEWINYVRPMSNIGLRGLSQTVSAEPLGMGRLNFLVSGSWFNQDQKLSEMYDTEHNSALRTGEKVNAGPMGSGVSVLRIGGSYGVNEEIDIFASVPMYIVNELTWPGMFMGGGQYTFPFPPEMAFRLAIHAHVIYGLRKANDDIDPYRVTYNPEFVSADVSYAGYDFEDIREDGQITLVLKVPMSIVHGNLRRAFKIHANPGVALIQNGPTLFLASGGFEIDPTEYLTVGLEGNFRTPVKDGHSFSDPLWLTPTVTYRSPYYGGGLFGWSVVGGADIRLSGETEFSSRQIRNAQEVDVPVGRGYALESYRLFGGVVFSFDLLASKRAEMIRKARESAAEKARLRKQAALTAAQKDSIAQKAYADSLAMAAEMAAKAEKARQDSIAQAADAAEREAQLKSEAGAREAQLKSEAGAREAQLMAEAEQKRIADSIALAEVNRRLAEEKAKRSAAEQQMLSTGMLVLDGVFFVTGKAEIQLNSRGYLTTLAKMLVKYPKLKIEIGGHTDNTGRLETNMTLSQSRAEAVFMFMHNVEPSLAQMLTTKGYGPTVPKADNNTAAGREVNRRVEVRVLNPEVLKEYNP
ncbi:MAG: OmpA family protein [Chitinispirillales bacterium]|nr:OmpA family protein [Chitinispirillales bacterium]